MFDKFDFWQYRPNANCWDFVREFLIEKAGVPPKDVPKYGISPNDKALMTKAADHVKKSFVECEPRQYAIACHYIGRTIIHVGVVDGGRVRHTSSKWGTTKSTIKEFEAMSRTTIYKIHHNLWQH